MSIKTVVISNQSQLDRFLSAGYRPEDFAIFCDNLYFSKTLRACGFIFSELDEWLLRDRWEEVNAWGCGAATAWIGAERMHPTPLKYDFPSVFYLFFSHILVHAAKNLLFARWLLASAKPDMVVVFDEKPKKVYPLFSGNFFLNHFLGATASQQGIPVEHIGADHEKSAPKERTVPGAGKIIAFLRIFCQTINAFFFSKKRARGIWVYGSLRHTESLIRCFRRRKIPFFLYDRRFNFEQFFFCLCNGIPYVTPPTKIKMLPADYAAFMRQSMDQILRSFKNAAQGLPFVFEGTDLAPFIEGFVLSGLQPFLRELAESEVEYQSVLDRFHVSALLSDEDYARRGGFLAAFLKKNAIPVFCVSHSATATDFKVPEPLRCFGQSITFVNSDFERDAYLFRGWDPAVVKRTGVPRYDGFKNSFPTVSPRPNKPLKLLFCANRYVENYDHPDRYGYLGHMLPAMSETIKPTAESFFKVIKDLEGVEVILKPHGTMGVTQWKRLVAVHHLQSRVKIITFDTVIDRFFGECDAVVASYWSTAVVEAAICGIPVIFMDFKNLQRSSVQKFAESGLCRLVRNQDELKKSILELSQSDCDTSSRNQRLVDYFIGQPDGKATVRVADFIQNQLTQTKY